MPRGRRATGTGDRRAGRLDRVSLSILLLCLFMAFVCCAVILRGVRQEVAVAGNAYGVAAGTRPLPPFQPAEGFFSAQSESAVVTNGLFLARRASLMPPDAARTSET